MVEQIEAPDNQQGQTQKRVARNAGIYLIVQLFSWCVTFIGLSIVPRALGEQVNGEFVLASSTLGLVFGFASFCIDSFLIREIGRDARQADLLVRATLGLRITMLLIVFPASYLALHIIQASHAVVLYGLLLFPSLFIGSLGEPLRSALAGEERAREVSFSDFCLTGWSLVAIPLLRYGAMALVIAGTTTHIIAFLLKWRWLHTTLSMRPIFSPRLWGQLIRGGVPFMMNNYINILNGYTALVVVKHFLTEAAVGELSLSSKLIGTFMVVPTVLSAALLPVLTRMADMDMRSFAQAKVRVMTVLIVSCMPVIAGVMLLAQPLCHLLYRNKFADVPLTLQLSAVQLLPLYIITVVYQFLVAQRRNGIWSLVLAGTLVINTVAAYLLVPLTMRLLHNGVVGAMLANTVAEMTAMAVAFVLIRFNPLSPALLGRLARGLAATAVMALVVWQAREGLGHLSVGSSTLSSALQLFVPAGLGTVVFVVAAGVLRAFPEQEQQLVVNTLRRKLRRAN